MTVHRKCIISIMSCALLITPLTLLHSLVVSVYQNSPLLTASLQACNQLLIISTLTLHNQQFIQRIISIMKREIDLQGCGLATQR